MTTAAAGSLTTLRSRASSPPRAAELSSAALPSRSPGDLPPGPYQPKTLNELLLLVITNASESRRGLACFLWFEEFAAEVSTEGISRGS